MLYTTTDNNTDKWKIYGTGILIIIGLFARDMYGVGINKYLFLLLAMIPIFFAEIKNVAVFSCFLIPLYVGLPGNLISVCLLIRLIFTLVKYRIPIDKTGFLLTFLVTTYIGLQNIFTGYTGTYHFMAAFDFITLSLLMMVLREYGGGKDAIIAYAFGNFIVGIVMLTSTLSYYSITDLMNPATRLGYTGMLISNTGANMATSIDPNFYAMNTIACVSTVGLLFRQIQSFKTRLLIGISVLGSVICCLIGLSRTFIILLIVWGILWLVCQRDVKKIISTLLIGCILFFSFLYFMPTIAEGLSMRFETSDMVGGNGRINLIVQYFTLWFEKKVSILFGIGLFNCHTHCTPLMYVFGIGIIGSLILLGWFVYQWIRCKEYCEGIMLKKCIPLLVTLVGYSTIPAAGAINYTFPILISILVITIDCEAEESYEKSNEDIWQGAISFRE